ncbi:MAG: hypothetical protein KDC67_15805 [Ignavibacteriae bacterium]|nr:hypothetical protein [Ignavibacteriota bacterium]MCB0746062.1 hypothetical protein [Ignavibacteriota bacterium]
MSNQKYLVKLFTIIFLLNGIVLSQDIGKIFDKDEANKLYGEVIEENSVTASELDSFLSSCDKYIMFRLVNNNLTVLGDNRALIFSTENYLENDEVFHIFTKNKVVELLAKGNGGQILVQRRKEVLTVNYGTLTLEMAMNCPPFCK